MSKQKKPGGAVGKGGVNPAPWSADLTVRVAAEQLVTVPIDDLVPYANNARVHSKSQIAQLRASLWEFGFVTPVLIDFENNIIAGHARVEAARAVGMPEVPCVLVTNLTEAQRKAYILADNRLSETAAWDEPMRKLELERLRALDAQRAAGKSLFGAGFLLSERAAAERTAAERAVAERAAAERVDTKWQLSERERAIIRSLGGDGNAGTETADGCGEG